MTDYIERLSKDGNTLLTMKFPPTKWAIPTVLPEGVALFGGREKQGKSWLALGLCISVATGGKALGTLEVEQGDAFYISLEDKAPRLQERLFEMLQGEPTDLSRFHFVNEWRRANEGGIEDLKLWLEHYPEARLVVFDTLKKIRPLEKGNRRMYDVDYEALAPWVEVAAEYNIAIIFVHHLNQDTEHDDPYDAFHGSAGLTAATENVLLLTRQRGEADANLLVDGKDVAESRNLALRWNANICSWSIEGDGLLFAMSPARRDIVEAIGSEALPPTEVQERIKRTKGVEKNINTLKTTMRRMEQSGILTVSSDGRYSVSGSVNSVISVNPEDNPFSRDVNPVNSVTREPSLEAV